MDPLKSEHGFDTSCGYFGVSVKRPESHFRSCDSIRVIYDEFIDTIHSPHGAVIPWKRGEPSTDEVKQLLKWAHVPMHIQEACAVNMIFRCVDEILKEKEKEGKDHGLTSILVEITSDKETVEDYDQTDKHHQYKGAIDMDAFFKEFGGGVNRFRKKRRF